MSAKSQTVELTGVQLEIIRRYDTCRVANAIEEFGVRLRNEGFTRPGLRCMFPHLSSMLGYAVTAKLRCSDPPMSGKRYPERTDWWSLMQSFPAPRVAVLEDVGPQPGIGADVGEVHAVILQTLGCAGVVTNGSVRDLPAVEALGFPMFACHVSVSHAYAHIVEIGSPVEICGLRIVPGDLLYGDCHGLISIPKEVAPELPAVIERHMRRERRIIGLCRSPEFSLSRLRSEVEGPR